MTETITGASSMPKEAKKERSSSSRESAAEKAAIAQLVKGARDRGEDITGPQGLSNSITATVLEAAGGGDHRPPRARQAPSARGWRGEHP